MLNPHYLLIDSLSCSASNNNLEPILNQISFSVKEGQLIAILGHNGSGKTTLFKCINQLFPYSGTITLNNNNLQNLNQSQLSQNIVTLSQTLNQNFFMSLSIYENFKLWLAGLQPLKNNFTKEQMKQYLATFNNKFATGFHLPIQVLSGGEKQCLAMAFILKSPPKLLLLDEHTSALDRKTTSHVMEFTRNKIKQFNLTCLMIIHDINLAIKYADRIITLKNGGIVSDQLNANTQKEKAKENAAVN